MSGVTVAQLAETLKIPVERLLVQLEEAGVSVGGADDVVSADAKMELLNHLRRSHGHQEQRDTLSPRKITINRRAKTELKVAGGQGRSRTVNVEVRKKKSYVNRQVLEEQARQHGALRAHRRGRARSGVGGEGVEQRRGEDVHRSAHAAEGRLADELVNRLAASRVALVALVVLAGARLADGGLGDAVGQRRAAGKVQRLLQQRIPHVMA